MYITKSIVDYSSISKETELGYIFKDYPYILIDKQGRNIYRLSRSNPSIIKDRIPITLSNPKIRVLNSDNKECRLAVYTLYNLIFTKVPILPVYIKPLQTCRPDIFTEVDTSPGHYYIPGYNKDYAFSQLGAVWSFKSRSYMVQHINDGGYMVVHLRNPIDKSNKLVRIHRLLAKCFIPLPEGVEGDIDTLTINHKDHDRTNNALSNLEWMVREDNCKEPWDNGYCDDKYREVFCIDIHNKNISLFKGIKLAAEALNLSYDRVRTLINRDIGCSVFDERYLIGYTDLEQFKNIVSEYKSVIAHMLNVLNFEGNYRVTNSETGEVYIANDISSVCGKTCSPKVGIINYLMNPYSGELYRNKFKIELV